LIIKELDIWPRKFITWLTRQPSGVPAGRLAYKYKCSFFSDDITLVVAALHDVYKGTGILLFAGQGAVPAAAVLGSGIYQLSPTVEHTKEIEFCNAHQHRFEYIVLSIAVGRKCI